MTRGQLRHRTLLRLKQFKETITEDFDDSHELINALLEEGHKAWCRETLVLEAKDSSLTYSSSNDGFALPSDFIKVKDDYLEWATSDDQYSRIIPSSISYVKNRRNEWKDLSDETAEEIGPGHYCIFNDYIVLDSTTQDSPILYYYKYDDAFTDDDSSPSYKEEYHKFLIDYTIWQMTGDQLAQAQWERGISNQLQKKIKINSKQSRYIAF